MFRAYPKGLLMRAGLASQHIYSNVTASPLQHTWTENREAFINTNFNLFIDTAKAKNKRETLKGLEDKLTEEELKRWRLTGYGVKAEYPIPHKPAMLTIEKIRRHTIKLVTKCDWGTAWFLDYIIPKDGKYPTKWFIATAAHVIKRYEFLENKYQQELPKGKCTRGKEKHTPLLLIKEIPNKFQKTTEEYKKWHKRVWDEFNLNEIMKSEDKKEDLQMAYIYKPNLFYVPMNFLGTMVDSKTKQIQNYYKDFAVLEVDFKTEQRAKIMTEGIYDRYLNKNKKQKNKWKSLDFFKKELLQQYSAKELLTKVPKIFIGGYPSESKNHNKFISNYHRSNTWAGVLKEYRDIFSLKNKYGQFIYGHANVWKIYSINKNLPLSWNGKSFKEWSYGYTVTGYLMETGSSGSVVTDIDGGVLGVNVMANSYDYINIITPLRSDGIYNKKGEIILPKYDLLKGAPGQKESYKSQLDKYYKDENTFLRETGLDKPIS